MGAGSAGCGIAGAIVEVLENGGMSRAEALRRCWLIDKDGLIHDGLEDLTPAQQRFARSTSEVNSISCRNPSLADIVNHTKPHALIGVCAQPKIFTRDVILAQTSHVEQPIILALSNPMARAEVAPADALDWTDGRALLGTGSPVSDVTIGNTAHSILT